MFGIDISSLTTNVVVGYGISWLYFAIAYKLLRLLFGKVKSAFIAYATSWVVWIAASTLLQIYNPLGSA